MLLPTRAAISFAARREPGLCGLTHMVSGVGNASDSLSEFHHETEGLVLVSPGNLESQRAAAWRSGGVTRIGTQAEPVEMGVEVAYS